MNFLTPLFLSGPLRKPAQMLQEQEYGGHASIHDDKMADKLGFRGAPIEGPTHFSLYPPLFDRIWGKAWFERGCISAHYQTMVVEGEETRAFAVLPAPGATRTRAWVEKADGTPVQEASASIGPEHGETLLEARMAELRPAGNLVILEDLKVGMAGAEDEMVRMDPDQHMGALYPFSLNQKLDKITETSSWYSDANASPWGRPIIPLEMVSVLAEYTNAKARWPVKGPAVGLFADQEIRMIAGPLLVGACYELEREVVAMSGSRRTESCWILTRVFEPGEDTVLATMLLNSATLKESYPRYAAELASLQGDRGNG